jgi:hypothetical protein
MLGKLLGVAAALALPALLVAQTPKTPLHGKATHALGDVVRPAGDVAHNQSDGAKAENGKDAKEGPDVDEDKKGGTGSEVAEGPDVKEGHDVQEGPDAKEGPDAAAQAKGDGGETGETDGKDGKAPPSPAGHRIGHHKP